MNFYEFLVSNLKKSNLPYGVGTTPLAEKEVCVWADDAFYIFTFSVDYRLKEMIKNPKI